MKKWIKIILIAITFLMVMDVKTLAEEVEVGYSDWSTEKTGAPGELSAIQYGRLLPKEWSEWSTEKPSSLFVRNREGKTNHYSYDGEQKFWFDAYEKELFTWDFKGRAKVTYFYADVDTYVNHTWENYDGPPLQLYCDNRLIASVGRHDYLANWNPTLNCECSFLTLKMSTNNGSGRNTTSMVGTWATTTSTEYSYVISWKEGGDWRFEEPYETIYGENSQIPTQRTVYSHPISYRIIYDLDGGEFVGDVKDQYTVLEEVVLPKAYKKGYEFLGFFDGDKYIERIEKGTHRDITLTARYRRKEPLLTVAYTYFDSEDQIMPIKELVQVAGAHAYDELDGDISSLITVDSIYYEGTGSTINNPDGLILNNPQTIYVTFSVTNSGGIKASVMRKFIILGKGEIVDLDTKNDVEIYPRYINETNSNSLNDRSIWKNDYQSILLEAYAKARKDG